MVLTTFVVSSPAILKASLSVYEAAGAATYLVESVLDLDQDITAQVFIDNSDRFLFFIRLASLLPSETEVVTVNHCSCWVSVAPKGLSI